MIEVAETPKRALPAQDEDSEPDLIDPQFLKKLKRLIKAIEEDPNHVECKKSELSSGRKEKEGIPDLQTDAGMLPIGNIRRTPELPRLLLSDITNLEEHLDYCEGLVQ